MFVARQWEQRRRLATVSCSFTLVTSEAVEVLATRVVVTMNSEVHHRVHKSPTMDPVLGLRRQWRRGTEGNRGNKWEPKCWVPCVTAVSSNWYSCSWPLTALSECCNILQLRPSVAPRTPLVATHNTKRGAALRWAVRNKSRLPGRQKNVSSTKDQKM
jgi:hypothetical protein